jgi:N-acetylmuramoyl-L-alanine amidase
MHMARGVAVRLGTSRTLVPKPGPVRANPTSSDDGEEAGNQGNQAPLGFGRSRFTRERSLVRAQPRPSERPAFAHAERLRPSDFAGHDDIDVRTDLAGLNLSKVPKVFVECGNVKSPHDSSLHTDPRWRGRLVRVIAGALRAYLTSAG